MIVAQNVMLAVFYKAASDRSESTTTWLNIHIEIYYFNFLHEKRQFCCQHRQVKLFVYIDNSICHNGRKATAEIFGQAWMLFSSILFARPEFVRLLALWNVEKQDEGPDVSGSWMSWQQFCKIWHSEISNPFSSIRWNVLIGSSSTRKSTILNSNRKSSESLPQGENDQGRELLHIVDELQPCLQKISTEPKVICGDH
jgi:hypothetical protein